MNVAEYLKGLEACESAVKWAEMYGFTSLKEAWDACKMPGWKGWLAHRLGITWEQRAAVAKGECPCSTCIGSKITWPMIEALLQQQEVPAHAQ